MSTCEKFLGDAGPLAEATLADLPAFAEARVLGVRDDAVDGDAGDAARLKAMGLCVGRRVQLVQRGDPLILRALGIRIGLSRRLAERVLVEPLNTATLVCRDRGAR